MGPGVLVVLGRSKWIGKGGRSAGKKDPMWPAVCKSGGLSLVKHTTKEFTVIYLDFFSISVSDSEKKYNAM